MYQQNYNKSRQASLDKAYEASRKLKSIRSFLNHTRAGIGAEPESEARDLKLGLIDTIYNAIDDIAGWSAEEREAEIKEAKRAEREAKAAATRTLNTGCSHYNMVDGVEKCSVDMDMTFCGPKCAYATNQVCSLKVKKSGIVMNDSAREQMRSRRQEDDGKLSWDELQRQL